VFEGGEKALHQSVDPAAALDRHTPANLMPPQQLAVSQRQVLAPLGFYLGLPKTTISRSRCSRTVSSAQGTPHQAASRCGNDSTHRVISTRLVLVKAQKPISSGWSPAGPSAPELGHGGPSSSDLAFASAGAPAAAPTYWRLAIHRLDMVSAIC
jgi:hypothetical protein